MRSDCLRQAVQVVCVVLRGAICMCGCGANGVMAKQLPMSIVDAVRGVPVQLLLGGQSGQVSFRVTDELAVIASACSSGRAKPGRSIWLSTCMTWMMSTEPYMVLLDCMLDNEKMAVIPDGWLMPSSLNRAERSAVTSFSSVCTAAPVYQTRWSCPSPQHSKQQYPSSSPVCSQLASA